MPQNSRKAQIWRYLVPLKASVHIMIQNTDAMRRLPEEPLRPQVPFPQPRLPGSGPSSTLAEERQKVAFWMGWSQDCGLGDTGPREGKGKAPHWKQESESPRAECCDAPFASPLGSWNLQPPDESWGDCSLKKLAHSKEETLWCWPLPHPYGMASLYLSTRRQSHQSRSPTHRQRFQKPLQGLVPDSQQCPQVRRKPLIWVKISKQWDNS